MTLWQRIKVWFSRGLKSDVQPAPSVRIPIENVSPVDLPKTKEPNPQGSGPDNGICATLSWEKNHPERKAWSDFAFSLIYAELFAAFDSAKDAETIYPGYRALSTRQRATVWCEFISSLAWFECASYNKATKTYDWDPTNNSVDVGQKGDLDTYSVGLLQMSVCDQESSGWGKFQLGYTFKDLQDPIKNMNLGLRVMAYLIRKHGIVCVPKGHSPYWATLSGGQYDKTEEIIARVRKLKFA